MGAKNKHGPGDTDLWEGEEKRQKVRGAQTL